MKVQKRIDAACRDIEKFSLVEIEHALWDAAERIDHLERVLKHIKKTHGVYPDGSVSVDLYSDDHQPNLKSLIKWALKEQHW